MASTIKTHNMKCVRTYVDADRIYREKELPGKFFWQDNWRPLDKPTMPHKRLVWNEEDRAYECTLYDTALVTYYDNGVVKVVLYDSASSRAFQHKTLPYGVSILRRQNLSYLEVETRNGTEWFQNDGYPFLLSRDHNQHWQVHAGSRVRRREFVDRSKSAILRHELKPFLDWYKATGRIVGWETNEQKFADEERLNDVNIVNPDEWPYMAKFMRNERTFMDVTLNLHGARVAKEIPNTTPPRRGRTKEFT